MGTEWRPSTSMKARLDRSAIFAACPRVTFPTSKSLTASSVLASSLERVSGSSTLSSETLIRCTSTGHLTGLSCRDPLPVAPPTRRWREKHPRISPQFHAKHARVYGCRDVSAPQYRCDSAKLEAALLIHRALPTSSL